VIECHPKGRPGNKFNVAVRTPGNGLVVIDQLNLAVAEADARETLRTRSAMVDWDQLREECYECWLRSPRTRSGISRVHPRKSQASELVKLVLDIEGVELFHTPKARRTSPMPVGDHRETLPRSSPRRSAWLVVPVLPEHEKTPSAQALQDAIGTISGHAQYEGEERAVHVRIAECDGDIWLDLCDPKWRAVRVIGRVERRAERQVPVKFVRGRACRRSRSRSSAALIEELRPLLNMPDDDAWTLTVGWLVGAFHPSGPYGVLSISGEHGSAKSTTSKLVRRCD
jgi:hypothetical protein